MKKFFRRTTPKFLIYCHTVDNEKPSDIDLKVVEL